MPFFLLLLLAAPSPAAPVEALALRASLRTALEHVGLTPATPELDAKLAVFMSRLPAAAAIDALPALPRRKALETQRTLAVVSEALKGLDVERIKAMSPEQVAGTAARLWESVRPQAQLDAVAESDFNKRRSFLTAYMLGRGYDRALDAMAFAEQYHTGKRKGGVTPEFQHQIEIAQFLTTLKGLRDEQTALAAAFLHDVMEDYDVPLEEMERRFGPELAAIVWKLTKVHRGVKKGMDAYFHEIAADPIASLVKGADRSHNVQSMVAVFTPEHQRRYIDEATSRVLPMLKRAKQNFPAQSSAYFSIESRLKGQIELIEAVLEAHSRRGPDGAR